MNIRYPIYEGVYRILTEENGIQIIKKHRDIVPAATAVRDDIPGGVYAGNGICRMKGL